jgi:hypothetical protein
MILIPDFSTATAAPWTADVTLQVIHDAQDQAGKPVPTAPRNVLRRIVELYNAEGWRPVVAPEMEFFLTARNLDPNMPVMPPMGRSGRRAAGKQAYSMSAVDEYGKVIDDIYDFAEAQGFEIDGILQEGGAGQVEINLAHGDPVRLADEIFFFKRLIREAALRHDCFATFMAKPIEGEPGSAMHIHHSVVDLKTGKNIFSDKKGGETPEFLHFIAGMQTHLPAAVALFVIPFFIIDATVTRGAFTSEDAARTADVLRNFAWGVPAFVLAKVLTPPFFAREDTRRPMIFSIASVAITVALGSALFFGMEQAGMDGVVGLAIATSTSAWINVALLGGVLVKEEAWNVTGRFLSRFVRVLAASLAMAAVLVPASIFYDDLARLFLAKEVAVLVVCGAGALVYGVCIVLFRAVSPAELKAVLRREPGASTPSGLD